MNSVDRWQHIISTSDSSDGMSISILFDVQTNHGRDYINHPSHHSNDMQYDCDGKAITDPTDSEGRLRFICLCFYSHILIINIYRLQLSTDCLVGGKYSNISPGFPLLLLFSMPSTK